MAGTAGSTLLWVSPVFFLLSLFMKTWTDTVLSIAGASIFVLGQGLLLLRWSKSP